MSYELSSQEKNSESNSTLRYRSLRIEFGRKSKRRTENGVTQSYLSDKKELVLLGLLWRSRREEEAEAQVKDWN